MVLKFRTNTDNKMKDICSSQMRYILSSSTSPVKLKTMKLVFVASSLSTEHEEVKAKTKTGWLSIGIMYPRGATFLPVDYCSLC